MAPRVRDDLPHAVRVVETEWIPLADGTRLAARLWLPEGAGPRAGDPRVPALPPERRHAGGRPSADGLVRRRTATPARASTSAAPATPTGSSRTSTPSRSCRTASRSSPGSPQQPWCDGKVGMVGTSWSGFNGLQLAARTPPALGAVVSVLRERRPLRRRRALPRRARAPHGHGAVGQLHALVERAAARSRDRRRRLARAVARAPRAHAALRRALARATSCATTTGGTARPARTTPASAAR